MAIRHIVVFEFHEWVDEDTIQEAVNLLREKLSQAPGVLSFEVERTRDTRTHKPPVVSEMVLFEDEAARQRFLESDAHTEFGKVMGKISNWALPSFYPIPPE